MTVPPRFSSAADGSLQERLGRPPRDASVNNEQKYVPFFLLSARHSCLLTIERLSRFPFCLHFPVFFFRFSTRRPSAPLSGKFQFLRANSPPRPQPCLFFARIRLSTCSSKSFLQGPGLRPVMGPLSLILSSPPRYFVGGSTPRLAERSRNVVPLPFSGNVPHLFSHFPGSLSPSVRRGLNGQKTPYGFRLPPQAKFSGIPRMRLPHLKFHPFRQHLIDPPKAFLPRRLMLPAKNFCSPPPRNSPQLRNLPPNPPSP